MANSIDPGYKLFAKVFVLVCRVEKVNAISQIIASKAVSRVINSRALTGEKPCIYKAIHVLLMHGYATFNMLVPGPQYCCRQEMCTALSLNEHSPRDIREKAKQNSARSKAKCSKCFQFLCNNSDQTWFFNALTFARSIGRCWKLRPSALVFNTSNGTWRMLMYEKPCLIPISALARKQNQ